MTKKQLAMAATYGLVLTIGITILLTGYGHSFDIQRDPSGQVISTVKGVWTELTLTLRNTGPEVIGSNISLNGQCVQSTVNADHMRIQCMDSDASSSGALCYSYQILFHAENDINIGLCVYTLRKSGIPRPTNYPQYRIKVIEKTITPTSSNGIASGNIETTESNEIAADTCTNTILPTVATILGVFLGVSLLGNLFQFVYKKLRRNTERGSPRRSITPAMQVSPMTHTQQTQNTTLSMPPVVPVLAADKETTITIPPKRINTVRPAEGTGSQQITIDGFAVEHETG